MRTFRTYLRELCSDPAFLDLYLEQCTICPNTAKIINAIVEQGLSKEDVAHRAGIDPASLDLLESADRCSFEEIQKLCRALGFAVPTACRKKRARDREKI